MTMAGDREREVYETANGIYLGIKDALREREVDAGEGIAICHLVAGWLEGSANAQAVLAHRGLADVPYFKEEER